MTLCNRPAATLGCLLLVVLPRFALAQNIVVPNALANVEGNSNNSYPFDIVTGTMRYQQVYAASQFSSITSPTLITAISFRPDGIFGDPFSSTLPSIQINLSTTSSIPDSLSTSFASNVGGNDTQVFSGALTLSSTYTGSPTPNFDIVINLQTPFLYNPAAGNLLMDVRNFGAGLTTVFDLESTFGDSVSRVAVSNVSASTGIADTGGLVTQFTFAAVPEPTTWTLIGVCTLGCGVFAWRKKQLAIRAGMAKLKR